MTTSAPLQVAVIRHPIDQDTAPLEEAICRAFQGGVEASGYSAVGDDLGVQMRLFNATPVVSPPELLDGFCHTLVVVLVDRNFLEKGDSALWAWVAACWRHVDASLGRHALHVLPMEERQAREAIKLQPELGSLQMLSVQHYGEHAIRPAMLAIHSVHLCRILLAGALPQTAVMGQPAGFLRLFISHAKVDGLPLAHSLRHQIQITSWLKGFYDAEDLPAGSNWQRELERGVASSLIIMLRTEAYDGRPWCQNEMFWADEYATPAIVVEARTGLNFRGTALPLDRLPTVRIPDGNLIRVLFLAVREGLRYLHFMRRVEMMKAQGDLPHPLELRVFSSAPSMAALLRACRSLVTAKTASGTPHMILYPDPPLRIGVYEAAAALVATYAPRGTHLVTPNTLAAASP